MEKANLLDRGDTMEKGNTTSDKTVFVVDDDPGVLKAIAFMVKTADLNVATYASAKAFLDAYTSDAPGCLVLDVRMPGQSGLELQEVLTARGVTIPIIFVTGHGDVGMCAHAMKAGAIDFIEKPFDKGQLLRSIRNAVSLDAQQRRKRARRRVFQECHDLLTAREKEVMELMAAGNHTKQIGARLGISIKTVDKHRAKVLEKMQVENVVELVRMMLEPDAGRQGSQRAC